MQNDAVVTEIAPGPAGLLAVTVNGTARYARKVVLATGQDGCGAWWMPPFAAALPAARRAHTADAIDFAALRGRRVAVLGAGASAMDNAATALEAGAATVTVFCRRAVPQLVQPYRLITYAGFLRHVSDLPDEWRWRFMARVLGMREGFPQPTYDRCARHAGFTLLSGAGITGATDGPDGLELVTARGRFTADFLICGTGVDMDFTLRPELRHCAANIARWSDRYQPPEAERDDRLGRFPYLGPDYALLPRQPGRTEWMRDLHLFGIASTMSFGPSGSSINAMTTAVPKLVAGLTRGLFEGDLARHWAALEAYDVPQAVLGSAP